jgi:hypothetical protein
VSKGRGNGRRGGSRKIAIQGGRHSPEASAGLGMAFCTHERSHIGRKGDIEKLIERRGERRGEHRVE